MESPRYLPLEVYVTPVRAQAVNVRIESPTWFEPAIREDAYVSLLSSMQHNNVNRNPMIYTCIYIPKHIVTSIHDVQNEVQPENVKTKQNEILFMCILVY